MKIIPLILCILVSNLLFSQSDCSCWCASDSAKTIFIRNIPKGEYYSKLYFMKMNFIDSNGNKLIVMIPKNVAMRYAENVLNIEKDSIETFLLNAILTNKKFPLKDSIHMGQWSDFSHIKVDTALLNSLNAMSIKEVLKKYFIREVGLIKWEYSKLEMTLSCYLSDHYIVYAYLEVPARLTPEYRAKLGWNPKCWD